MYVSGRAFLRKGETDCATEKESDREKKRGIIIVSKKKLKK